MSTRRANPNAPLSQERYMSSPEFAELQAISGTAVAKRAALLVSPAKRELLWFIQGMSLAEGGLRQLAKGLIEMFPQRIIPVSRYTLTGHYDGEDISREQCIEFALASRPARCVSKFSGEVHGAPSLEEFLIDLCINPKMQIRLGGEDSIVNEFEADRVMNKLPEVGKDAFRDAKLPYFKDIIGALVEYKRRHEEKARAEFCATAISRQIWKQLDDALRSKTMIVLDGLEGRGKTEAVRAWCAGHMGVSRFLSLKGTNTKTAHFREFARALGVGHGNSYKVSEMQANVEEVLRASNLMLVIDEAHFFFNQAPRMNTRPEMLDYIDTALCNPPVPVALVTTPQFMICMERAAGQVGWNYRQFKRRCKRYCRLPAKNTPEDVEAVARHLLPGADRATIKQVMAYEALSKRDLSAVGDVVRESKLLAEQEGAAKVAFEHVKRAMHEVLLVNDLPWAQMEARLRNQKQGRRALPEANVLAPEAGQEQPEAPDREIIPQLVPGVGSANRLRFRQPGPALVEAPG